MRKKQVHFLKCMIVILFSLIMGSAMMSVQTFAAESEKITVELEGIKYLKGREWADNETFTFVLKGINGAPMPTEANGQDTLEFEVSRTDDRLNIGIFGKIIIYDEPGTYAYELFEKTGTSSGIIYDTYVSEITVEISRDDAGKLVAEKNVTARTDLETKVGVSGFVNKYESKMMYPGLNVEKTLYGRDMKAGEFEFNISCENPNSKKRGISEIDASFHVDGHAAGETCVSTGKLADLAFTQDDSNKQFIYKINEVLPADDDATQEGIQYQGVTYDEQQYWVVITPRDNGDGTMHIVTEVFNDEMRLNDNLVASWDTDKEGIPTVSFENEYKEEEIVPNVTPEETEEPENTEEPKEDSKEELKEELKEGSKEDSKEAAPTTGDNSSIWLWFTLLLISCPALLVSFRKMER